MWVFLTDSFLSIVVDPDRPGNLLVRARRRQDIKRVFPEARVDSRSGTDYAFRASLPRPMVGAAIEAEVRRVDYENFKDEVGLPPRGKRNASRESRERHDCYLRVWQAMLGFQKQAPRGLQSSFHWSLPPEEMP